jgi:hypothetical protein
MSATQVIAPTALIPAPTANARWKTAEQGAGGAADAAHRTPEPQGAVALGPLGERRRQDREGGRGDDRATEPLGGTGDDEHRLVLGDPADQGGRREQRDAGDEDLAAPQEVRGAAAEEEETGERRRVGVVPLWRAGPSSGIAPATGSG